MSQPALTELLRGKGAHADPIACVEDLPAEMAVKRVDRFPHSISQLVLHMNYWMLRRIRGEKPKYPEHNAESFPLALDSDEAMEWNRRWARFLELLSEYGDLAESSRAELDRQIESVHEGDQKVAGTLEAVLWQMTVHNSYHLGQIALMRRVLGEWPPRGGGDTW